MIKPVGYYQPLRVYSGAKIATEGKKPNMGTCVLIVPPDSASATAAVGALMLQYQVRGYYCDRTVQTQVSIKVNVDRAPQFAEAKTLKLIPAMTLMALRERNFWWDLRNEVAAVLASKRAGSALQKRAEHLRDVVKEKAAMVRRQGYERVIALVPIVEAEDFNVFLKERCPASMFLSIFRRDHAIDLGADEIVFYSPKIGCFFRLDPKKRGKNDPAKVQSLMRTVVRMNVGAEPDAEDIMNLPPPGDVPSPSKIGPIEAAAAAVNKAAAAAGVKKPITDEELVAYDDMHAKAIEVTYSTVKGDHDVAVPEKEVDKALSADPEFVAATKELTDARAGSLVNIARSTAVEKLVAKHAEAEVVAPDGTKEKLAAVAARIVATKLDPPEFPVETDIPDVRKSTTRILDTAYSEHLLNKDIAAVVSHFGDDKSDFPVFVERAERTDASTPFSKLERLTLKLSVPGRRMQTFKVDLPKFGRSGEMLIDGVKYQLIKQMYQLPIIKIRLSGEDAVQFTTFYNKCILTRSGGSLSPDLSRLCKWAGGPTKSKRVNAFLGNASASAKGVPVSLEYTELSKRIVKIKAGDTSLLFDLAVAERDAIRPNKVKEAGMYPMGTKGNLDVVGRPDGEIGTINSGGDYSRLASSVYELVHAELSAEGLEAEVDSQTAGKKQAHAIAKVNDRKIPVAILLGFKDGIEIVLDKAGVRYEVTPVDRKGFPAGMNRTIRFKDFLLHYDGSSASTDLLVSGLGQIADHDVAWADLGKDGEAYHRYFSDIGSSSFGKSLRNHYRFFVDPVSKEVLEDIGLPGDYTGAFLHCIKLLADSRVSRKNDMSIYRVRSQEAVVGHLYKILAEAIREFKDKGADGISVKPNAVIRAFMDGGLVKPSPVLNPALEAEGRTEITFRGTGGARFGHAQGTEEHRAYDIGMRGIVGTGTPDDSSVGIIRKMSYNAIVVSARGYIDVNPGKELGPTQILGIGELLSPFTARHSDPPRQAMAIKQSEHTMPTVIQNKPLVGTGVDLTLAYFVSDEFAFVAAEDGQVESIDEKKGIVIVRYKSGKTAVIDLSERERKTPVGGFFITTRLSGDLKKGKRFKVGDVLAKDGSFFRDDRAGRPQYMSGCMCKVALAPLDSTYEDSSIITEGASSKLASYVTFTKDVAVSAMSSIERIVKKGQMIHAGDPLIVFEETFEDDDSGAVNRLLDKLGEKDTESLDEFAKTAPASKYGGDIVGIEIHYNRDLTEMSPSLRKIVQEYISMETSRSKIMRGAGKDQILNAPFVEKVSQQRHRGIEFDGVLFTFYVRTLSKAMAGEKISFEKAAKSIISTVLPDEQAPYAEDSPNEPIECVLSPMSVISRQTPDLLLAMYCNKLLVGLKEKVREIVGG